MSALRATKRHARLFLCQLRIFLLSATSAACSNAARFNKTRHSIVALVLSRNVGRPPVLLGAHLVGHSNAAPKPFRIRDALYRGRRNRLACCACLVVGRRLFVDYWFLGSYGWNPSRIVVSLLIPSLLVTTSLFNLRSSGECAAGAQRIISMVDGLHSHIVHRDGMADDVGALLCARLNGS